jgi:glycosyltransferase involved in cell wall biosynthesis
LNIAFHSNQIGLLGTEVSIFDYAQYCEKLWGHKVIVISKRNKIRQRAGANINHRSAIDKFQSRFPLYLYNDIDEIDNILLSNGIDLFYAQKRGDYDRVISASVKTVVHAVFKYHEPHGAVYAYIHDWLSKVMTNNVAPVVPYMCNMPRAAGNLREKLGIPRDALVFGRYGGIDSFDIDFVKEQVIELVRKHRDVYVLFMNTSNFLSGDNSLIAFIKELRLEESLKRIIFLPATASLQEKSEFINTCDAMLHARKRGETFGAAIAEFSSHNKPIITFAGNGSTKFEASHIQTLGSSGFYYNNSDELTYIFNHFLRDRVLIGRSDWDMYSHQYAPLVVMERFKSVFLDS